jgi:hypothetical protein
MGLGENMVSIYNLKTNLEGSKHDLDKAISIVRALDETLQDVKKIEFYAEAFFEAEERTQWIVDVILNIVGNNGDSLRIRVDRVSVWQQPRYSYQEWRIQRDADRPKAEQVLQSMFDKWGCVIRPIKE